jgi:hypothetical protein
VEWVMGGINKMHQQIAVIRLCEDSAFWEMSERYWSDDGEID